MASDTTATAFSVDVPGPVASKTVKVRAKAWAGRGVCEIRCLVESDGTVRVYDSVAGYYTVMHSLSESAQRRIRRLAASA